MVKIQLYVYNFNSFKVKSHLVCENIVPLGKQEKKVFFRNISWTGAPLVTFGSGLGNLTRNLMAKFLSGYMIFCGTPAVWLRLPLQDKHNNSDGHTITMEDSFLSSHMSSTYSDCLLYTDVPVSVNTLFSLSFLYIYLGKQTTCTTVWEVFGCCDEERDVIPACLALSHHTQQ